MHAQTHSLPYCRLPAALRGVSLLAAALLMQKVFAQEDDVKTLEDVVVSASRVEQRRFDAPAAIDAVQVDALRAGSPLVNLSELLSAVPGVQARERQNYAQDLQLSVRGFGTRSTFGVRGVRILIDGIPATMPDGQGQVSTASLTSASRIEVLRGPLAQLYGNAAGGVVQIFTKDPPLGAPAIGLSAGAGSDAQRQLEASIGGGTGTLSGLLDASHYTTDGYRDHSAAERNQLNAKLVARPSGDTTLTGVFNAFDQPTAQDPLGLTRAAFERNPRQVVPEALRFDTRKSAEQKQAGIVLDHRLSPDDTLNARVYGGTRQVFQTLAFSGGRPPRPAAWSISTAATAASASDGRTRPGSIKCRCAGRSAWKRTGCAKRGAASSTTPAAAARCGATKTTAPPIWMRSARPTGPSLRNGRRLPGCA